MSWSNVKLGDVCTLHYGKSLSGYSSGVTPGPEDCARVFGTNGPIGWTKEPLTDHPTLIIGRKGAYRGVQFSAGPSWTIDTAYFTTIDEARLHLKWFYFRLLLLDINRMNSGGAIPSTSRDDFYSVEIVLPTSEVQIKTAYILSCYDSLIENNRRRMALLEDAARMLYREWFVRFRFPGHEHVKFIDGVPEGWERKKLGSIITLKRGYDLPETKRISGEIPIVSSAGITGFHNEKKASGPGVVTGRYGTLGEVYYIEGDYWPLNTALYVNDFQGSHQLMISYLLKSELKGIITEKAAVPGLDRNVLHARTLIWPSAKLQHAFVEIVSDYQSQIQVLGAMIEKLTQAHDLLLPRLISGEIAV